RRGRGWIRRTACAGRISAAHNADMHIAAVALALVAAAIHVWIFVLESLWFRRPSVHRRFGLASEEDARIVRSFAYNQGFYNLFLAVGAALGVVLATSGNA